MAACGLQSSVSHPLCDYVKLGLKMSAQFLNRIVSTQNFHKKKTTNQFVEILMSVAWQGALGQGGWQLCLVLWEPWVCLPSGGGGMPAIMFYC